MVSITTIDDEPETATGLLSPITLKSQVSNLSMISRISRRSAPHRMDSTRGGSQVVSIELNSTFDSDDSSTLDGEALPHQQEDRISIQEIDVSDNLNDEPTITQSPQQSQQRRIPLSVSIKKTEPSSSSQEKKFFSWLDAASFLYVAQFAAFGYMARVFIGRLFGADCSAMGQDSLPEDNISSPDDFFAPFFSKICVTNNGLTEQTGGALFIDFPANCLGCFLMGMISHPRWPDRPLPWMHPQHALQKHKALIDGLRTGFCGCLTSFASWNTQMVRMLDGTETDLGPQIVAALFGYAIGLCGAFSSFVLGRLAHEWISSLYHPNEEQQHLLQEKESAQDSPDIEENLTSQPTQSLMEHEKEEVAAEEADLEQGDIVQTNKTKKETVSPANSNTEPPQLPQKVCCRAVSVIFNVYTGPPLFLVGILSLFLVGAVYYDIAFYQEVVMASCMAPIGALLRWKLTDLNWREGPWPTLAWVPWGTLLANLLAAMVSVAIAAVQIRYLADFESSWVSLLLPALKTGMAGSLSTVSTMLKEMFVLEKPGQSLLYATGSLTLAMLLSLLVYSPMVRS